MYGQVDLSPNILINSCMGMENHFQAQTDMRYIELPGIQLISNAGFL